MRNKVRRTQHWRVWAAAAERETVLFHRCWLRFLPGIILDCRGGHYVCTQCGKTFVYVQIWPLQDRLIARLAQRHKMLRSRIRELIKAV